MTKTVIAAHDLERIALQEIRSFPGCEYVTDIEIAYQLDKVLGTNWTIHVFTREGADMLRSNTRSTPHGRDCGIDMNCALSSRQIAQTPVTPADFFIRPWWELRGPTALG